MLLDHYLKVSRMCLSYISLDLCGMKNSTKEQLALTVDKCKILLEQVQNAQEFAPSDHDKDADVILEEDADVILEEDVDVMRELQQHTHLVMPR